MSWKYALSILIVVQTSNLILVKVVSNKLPKKSIGIFYQYLSCFLLSALYFLLVRNFEMKALIFLIAAVGFINALGAYFMWRAFELSLSKTSLLFPLMEVVTIGLAIIFLGEAGLWNLQLISGAALCFLAIWLFRVSPDSRKEVINKQWFFFTIAAILIFGIVSFLVKLFSFNVPREIFLLGLYGGSLLSSLVILKLEKESPFSVSIGKILLIFPVGFTTAGAMFALFWTYQLKGPVSLVLPLRGLAITAILVLLGWFIFRERKGLIKREWLGFLVGAIGAILIILR